MTTEQQDALRAMWSAFGLAEGTLFAPVAPEIADGKTQPARVESIGRTDDGLVEIVLRSEPPKPEPEPQDTERLLRTDPAAVTDRFYREYGGSYADAARFLWGD